MKQDRPEPPRAAADADEPEGAARARLESAYRERGAELSAWASRRAGAREDGEDLVQDLFLAALDGLARFERALDPMGWLYAGLRNRTVDLWRKRGRRGERGAGRVGLEAVEEIVAASGLGPAAALEREELAAALAEAVAALPREQRRVVEAQVYEGLTFEELSRRTGVPANTLAARKRYAIEKLSRALAAWFED